MKLNKLFTTGALCATLLMANACYAAEGGKEAPKNQPVKAEQMKNNSSHQNKGNIAQKDKKTPNKANLAKKDKKMPDKRSNRHDMKKHNDGFAQKKAPNHSAKKPAPPNHGPNNRVGYADNTTSELSVVWADSEKSLTIIK